MKKTEPKPTSNPPAPLELVAKDRGTEQFPYGRQAVGQRADLPFTVGR